MKAFLHQRTGSRGDMMQQIQQEPFTSWRVTTWRNVACRCEALWPREVLSQDNDGVKRSRRVKKTKNHSGKQSVCVWKPTITTLNKKKKKRKRKAAAVWERPRRFLGNWEEAFHLRAECCERESGTDQLRGESERPAVLHLSHGIRKLSSRAFQSPQRRNAIKKERKKAPGIINKAFGFTLFEVCATFFFPFLFKCSRSWGEH